MTAPIKMIDSEQREYSLSDTKDREDVLAILDAGDASAYYFTHSELTEALSSILKTL